MEIYRAGVQNASEPKIEDVIKTFEEYMKRKTTPKKCGDCKHCEMSKSIYEVGAGWCHNKESKNYHCRVSLRDCECEEYEENKQ